MASDMVVLPRANIIIPAPDGNKSVFLRREVLTDIPAWAADTAYFRGLVNDGKVLVSTASAAADEADKRAKAAKSKHKQTVEKAEGIAE